MQDAIAANLEDVRARIAAACERAGRSPDDVTLIAVSKTRPPEAINAAASVGQVIFGESRVQEACRKAEACSVGISWHFIGHLQSNKVRPAAAVFDMLHSVDSVPLLRALDDAAAFNGRRLDICLQVNVSGEASKFGIAPGDLPDLVVAATDCRSLRVRGLMTIPPAVRDPEDARPFFRCLRDLRQTCYDAAGLEGLGLSMGMSHDFEIAIAEGANWVRVGTAIFGRRSG